MPLAPRPVHAKQWRTCVKEAAPYQALSCRDLVCCAHDMHFPLRGRPTLHLDSRAGSLRTALPLMHDAAPDACSPSYQPPWGVVR
jgi:hypothetical protein